jgi:hypothetical protein
VGKEFLKAALPHASMETAVLGDRAELAREGEQGVLSGVIEGLLAEPISGEEKLPAAPIEDREGEHSIETRGELLAPLLEAVNEDFSIRVVCPEDVAARLEVTPEISMIVDLAIENNADRLILIPHRLRAALDVDDRQSPVAEVNPSFGINEQPFAVGPSMAKGPRHYGEVIAITLANEADQPAHQACGPQLICSRT